MKPIRTFLLLGLVAAILGGSCAYAAVVVELKPTPLSFNKTDTTAKEMGIYISGLPAPGWAGLVSFYLTWDKTKLTLENFALKSDALQNFLTGPVADGAVLTAGRFEGTGSIDAAQPVITFDVKLVAGVAAGTYTIGFKEEDTDNTFIWDSDFIPIEGVQWKDGVVKVSEGPPDPARLTSAGFNFAARQKDPVQGELTWTQGRADTVQFQYNAGAGWKAVSGTVNIVGRKATLQWNSGLTGTTSINLRARAIDQGKVWNGTAIVDAGNVGWVEAASPVIVDNEAPRLVAASGSGTGVTLTFQAGEVLGASAAVAANYTVEDLGALPAGQAIQVTKAEKIADNQVRLTLGAALQENHSYKVTVNNVLDAVGNAIAAATSRTFKILPKPTVESADFVRDGANTHVVVKFSKDMKDATPLTSADKWTVTEKVAGVTSAATTIAVSGVALQADKRTVRLTLAQAVKQNSQYEVTAPVGSQDSEGKQLEAADAKASFQTPFWHTFAKGLRMLGIPLTTTGRAVDVLKAKAVAFYDGTKYIVDRPAASQADVPGQIDLRTGVGYFARYDADQVVYFDGQNLRGDVTVAVPAGWSIITNPYVSAVGADVNININQVQLGDRALRFAWHYDGTDWQLLLNEVNPFGATNTMEPWKGYFVRAEAAGNVRVKAQAAGVESAGVLDLGDDAIVIRLVAKAGDVVDSANICGTGNSLVQVDNPPLGMSPVDLYFVGQDATPMAIDVRSGSASQKWEAVVTTSLPNTEVTIFAPDLSSVPADYAVILTDKDAGKKSYLRTSAGYTFTSGAEGATRRLVLELVPRAQCTLLSGVSAQQTAGGNVVVTFQLNGPAAVTAEVLNIAGRVVRRLVTDRTETAGTHSVTWNLTNSAGSAVPRGNYLVVLQARTEDGQQTKAVRPFSVNR